MQSAEWLGICLLVGAVACSPNPSCDEIAEWSIPISRGTSDEGADAIATAAPDGSLYVVIADPGPVHFGTETLTEATLAHVSASGDVLARVPIAPLANGYPGAIAANEAGQVAVLFYGASGTYVAAFSAELQLAWQVTMPEPFPGGFGSPFDIGPAGEVVVFGRTALGALRMFDATGQERWVWSTERTSVFLTRFATNGDVFAFADTGILEPGGPHRIRFAAANGAIVDDRVLAETPQIAEADGSFVVAGYTVGGAKNTAVRRFDANAELVWEREFDTRGFINPVLATTGDIVAQTSYGDDNPSYELMVLNGATGATRSIPMCSHLTLLGANEEHYLGLGLTGSSSIGLARFAMP